MLRGYDTTSGRQGKHDASLAQRWQRFTCFTKEAVEMSKEFVSHVAAESEIGKFYIETGRLCGISLCKNCGESLSSWLLC